MELGLPELLVILVIVLLVFGVGRVANVAGELGKSIRSFREGLSGDNAPAAAQPKPTPAEAAKPGPQPEAMPRAPLESTSPEANPLDEAKS